MFLAVITLTLFITYWSAKKADSASGFYAADGAISGPMNGLAIAGDFMSATTFLGISGLVFAVGFDAVIYILAPLAGLLVILTLVAERVRNLGKYTLADVLTARFQSDAVRTYAAACTLVISILYLIGQMVGAGALIQILFGIPYGYAVAIIGLLMILYVSIGGMVATTWVQIVKAVILVVGILYLSISILAAFDFDFDALFAMAASKHAEGEGLFEANGLLLDTFSSMSLGAALVFGMVGLPHILVRFFTVPDANAARQSVVVSLGIISVVFLMVFCIISFGGIALLTDQTAFFDEGRRLVGGNNMMIIHLSGLVGGELFKGVISAVAFATILAVVAGLAVAISGAISHDLYAQIWCKGKSTDRDEIRVVGLIAVGLGIIFEGQNLAYLVSLAFTVSASTNFPALILALYWRNLTASGMVIGGIIGLIFSVVSLIFGPAVWIDVLGNEEALFPFRYPVLFSMGAAFIGMWIVSKLNTSDSNDELNGKFEKQFIQGVFGVKDRSDI
jgi:cation/acetate symporter